VPSIVGAREGHGSRCRWCRGYFGGRLLKAGVDVTFVARGAHLEALNGNGLHVRSVRGDFTVPVRATEDLGSSRAADYVLVTVKSFDTDRIASNLAPLLSDDTAVVSLQNGVDNEERLGAVLGDDRVVGGAAYILATIVAPSVIDHTGGPASVVVGEWCGGTRERVTSLVEAFRTVNVTADGSSDIRAVLWSKFAFICAQAGVTAAVRLPSVRSGHSRRAASCSGISPPRCAR
jgi:2-dehydropantoate 2-reductase